MQAEITNWEGSWKRKPASDLVPIERFLDEFVFNTTDGGYGAAFRVKAIDPEGMTREQLDTVSLRISGSLRVIPANGVLYQYVLRRRGYNLPHKTYPEERAARDTKKRIQFLNETAGFGEIELFWVLYLPLNATKDKDHTLKTRRALRELNRTASLLQSQLAGAIDLQKMPADATASLFSYLLNLEPHLTTKRLRSRVRVNEQLSKTPVVKWHDDFLKIGHRFVQPFSMIRRPTGTRPNLFGALLKIDADFVLCSVFSPATAARIRKEVRSHETFMSFFKASFVTLAASVNSKPQSTYEKTANDLAAEKNTDKLAGILTDLDNGHVYGKYAMFGLVHGRTLDEVRNAMQAIHGVFGDPAEAEILEETVGALTAYYAMFPGHYQFAKPRSRFLKDQHYSNMAFVYAPFVGSIECESLGEYLAIYETRDRTPFFFTPYVNGVRGVLIIGATRRGKSMNGNFIVDAEQKFGGFTYVFDIGRSFESNVLSHGGTVTRIGLSESLGNPFALEPKEENVMFLFRFVRLLIEKSGVTLSAEEESDLAKKVRQMYRLDRSVRRLQTLSRLLPNHLELALSKWTVGGIYGRVFDNTEPLLGLGRVQAFEFQEVEANHKDLIEPSLFWLTHLINGVIYNPANLGVPKHLVFDELWKQMKNQELLGMVINSLKTGGKWLAGVTLLTQSEDDLGVSADLIKNACSMILFLGDPQMSRKKYREFYGLNEQQLDDIQSLKDRELYVWTAEWSKVLVLNLDQESYLKYTTKPKDIIVRNKAIAEHGRERAFEIMAAAG